MTELCQPLVEKAGYELVQLEFVQGGRRSRLRVVIDRQVGQGSVSLDDCANVSRRLDAALDVDDIVPGAYVLEVSSPGMARPLVRPSDFVRFAGIRARVRLATGPDGTRQTLVGRIAASRDGGFELEVVDRTGAPRVRFVRFEEVDRATLDPTLEEWERMGTAASGGPMAAVSGPEGCARR